MKDSKNQAVWARCHLAGEASGHDWTIMSSGVSGAHISRVRRRAARKRSARLPEGVVFAAWIVVAFIMPFSALVEVMPSLYF